MTGVYHMTEAEPYVVRVEPNPYDPNAPESPRDRCSDCYKPLNVATIDRGTIKIVRKVGRPKKGERRTRYCKIGKYCIPCELFFYPNGSPNYKMRLKSLKSMRDKRDRKLKRRRGK